ncbi:NAD(P)-binding protein [Trichoderma velutinum]
MARDRKFALVTGCGKGGIGEALILEYTRRGIYAIATVLPDENSDHLMAAGITWFPLDVTDEQSVINLKGKISSVTGGYLDILVNNAGICYTMTAVDTDVNAVKRMFEVNVFGPIQMVHYFHDMLIQASGTIVNIGSIGGVVPYIVKVLTVISGEVGTNILKNDVHRRLPEGSYYSPLAAEFEDHVQRTPKTTSRFKYASNVVSQSLRPSPVAWFWTGSATGIIRFLDMFAWRTIWDFFFYREFNLNKVKEAHITNIKRNT